MPEQSWPNHIPIFESAGLQLDFFPYYDCKTQDLAIGPMLAKLGEAKKRSIVLHQVCGHNPTALDPTLAQWKQIAEVLKERELIVLFDCTYVGFASEDPARDLEGVRLLRTYEIPMIIAQSYAKNMSLYGERVGALHIVTYSEKTADCVLSQLKHLIRRMYSNPPKYGAEIAKRMLGEHY